MKTKQPLIVISIIFLFSLACQTLAKPFAGGNSGDRPAQTQEATLQTTDSSSSPLAGLTYVINKRDYPASDKEIWQFGSNGEVSKILEGDRILYGPVFSPSGRQAVYTDYGNGFCTWLVDYDANKISSVACDGHIILDWLPGQPDTLLALKSYDRGVGSYLGTLETLSLIDGSVRELDSVLTSDVALSLDGRMFAYASSSYPPSGFLYSLDSGTVQFNPQDYGVDYPFAGRPAWSPDGKKIAWGLMGDANSAIGVFDLETKSGQVLHPFSDGDFNPDMMPGPNPPLASWSPDGKWLALDVCFHAKDQQDWCDSAQSGLWIMNEDGQTEHRIEGSFSGWSPDSQLVLSSVANYDANASELRVSRLDGSELVSLGKVADAYHEFSPVWSADGKYLAFKDADHMFIAETGSWQPRQLGESAKYRDVVWNPDGSHLVFTDENYTVWIAETGTWQPQQMAKIEVPVDADGNRPFLSFFWHNTLLPSFDTLTVLSPGTPAPSTTDPIEISSDCSNSVVLTAKDTSKGDYLEVCSNDQSYEIGPLAKGVFAVAPNNKFFIYCANNGLVYGARVGDTKLQSIGDVKDFSAILRDDIPIFQIEFTGSDPYKVTIREIGYKQNKIFSIPANFSIP